MGLIIGILGVSLVLLLVVAMALAEWANQDPGDWIRDAGRFFKRLSGKKEVPAGNASPVVPAGAASGRKPASARRSKPGAGSRPKAVKKMKTKRKNS